jgi:hypothetical protein
MSSQHNTKPLKLKEANYQKCRPLPAQIKLNDATLETNIVYDIDRSLNLIKNSILPTYALVDSKHNIIRLLNSMTPVEDFMTCEINSVTIHKLTHEQEQLWTHGVPCNCEEVHVVDTEAVSGLHAVNALPFLLPFLKSIKDPQLNEDC